MSLFLIISGISKSSEVVFALDTSNAVTPESIQKMKEFIIANLEQYLPTYKISLVRYGSTAEVDVPLTNKEKDLMEKLSDVQKIGGVRRIDKALLKIKDEVFVRTFDTVDAPSRQIVLFAQGANDPLKSNELKDVIRDLDYAKITYIGLGSEIPEDESLTISSSKASRLNVPIENLPSIYDDLFKTTTLNAGKFVLLKKVFN